MKTMKRHAHSRGFIFPSGLWARALIVVFTLSPVPGFVTKPPKQVTGQCLLKECFRHWFIRKPALCRVMGNCILWTANLTTSLVPCEEKKDQINFYMSIFLLWCFHQTAYCPRRDWFHLLLDFYTLDVPTAGRLGNLCFLVVLERKRHFKYSSCDLIQRSSILFTFGWDESECVFDYFLSRLHLL